MQLIRGIHNIRKEHHGCVATIGNFDGIHLGHQRVLKKLVRQAATLQLPALVITFEPQPLEFFRGQTAPARLMRFREKIMLLREFNVDRVLCLYFNAALADLSATDFVTKILLEKLGVRFLLVGDDFRFGKQRKGDYQLLQTLAKQHHFELAHTETVTFNQQRIGSSRVRDALTSGNFPLAKQLLDRPYFISGHVVHGDKRGTQLGFPTANLLLYRRVSPLTGVFAVKVHGIEQTALPGVANIGSRPTVDGKNHLLEVHLLDFQQTIYGRFVRVEFIQKLRAEQKFASLDALKQQIAQDVTLARTILT